MSGPARLRGTYPDRSPTTPSGERTNPPSISSSCSPAFARDPDLQRSLDADCVIVQTSPIWRTGRTMSADLCVRWRSTTTRESSLRKAACIWATTILGTRIDPGTRQPHRGRQGIGAGHRASETTARACRDGCRRDSGWVGLGTVIGLDWAPGLEGVWGWHCHGKGPSLSKFIGFAADGHHD